MSQISATADRTLSAFFDSRHDAEKAVDRLRDLGIPEAGIQLMPGNESDTPPEQRAEKHGGFFASLANFFMPDKDRYGYAEGLSRGGFLVTVSNLDATYYDRALDILDDEGSIDFDEREESWRSEGWKGYDATNFADEAVSADRAASTVQGSAASLGSGAGSSAADDRALSGRRDTELGRTRVRSYLRDDIWDTDGDSARRTDVEIEDERDSNGNLRRTER